MNKIPVSDLTEPQGSEGKGRTKMHIPRASTQVYETPTATFEYLDNRFGPFDLDAACLPEQLTAMTILARGGSICVPPDLDKWNLPGYSDEVLSRIQHDGLNTAWSGRVWLNPPFGELGDWLEQATNQVVLQTCELVCVLMPARTDTGYWQECLYTELRRTKTRWEADAHPTLHTVVNLRGRLTFVGQESPFNQPCVAAVFGYDVKDKEHP